MFTPIQIKVLDQDDGTGRLGWYYRRLDVGQDSWHTLPSSQLALTREEFAEDIRTNFPDALVLMEVVR